MPLDYTRPIRVKGTHEKVEILRTDLLGYWPILAVITCQNGSQYTATWARDWDGWENVPVPKRTGTVWVNVYEENFLVLHHSRKEADKWAERVLVGPQASIERGGPDRRLACVPVHWTEGEGL